MVQTATIPKSASEDMTLRTRNAAGDVVTIPVPKGAELTIHAAGLHYNRTSYMSHVRSSPVTSWVPHSAILGRPECV